MEHGRFDGISKFLARRLTRRTAIAATGAGVAASALGPSALARQGATPVASPATGSQSEVSFLFVQQFDSGTWQPSDQGDGVYTLTLSGAADHTIAFADRPDRLVTTFPTDDLIGVIGFTPDNLPNAALTVEGPDGRDVIVVELEGMDYDTESNSVTYTATVIPASEEENLRHLAMQQDDDQLPAEFGAGSLFIDSVSRVCDDDCLITCCGTTRATCVHFLAYDDCDHD